MKFFLLCLYCLFSFNASAEQFRNAYVSFELPDKWKCKLEHTEWVCRKETGPENKEAIIILTAKEVGPSDSLEAYSSHLATPHGSMIGGNKDKGSVAMPPKRINVNDHPWIDGLQLGSEIPNYYTRYLATIKQKIAILVTFSAHKKIYTKYSQDFFKAINSLRVIAAPSLLSGTSAEVGGNAGILGISAGSIPTEMMLDEGAGGPQDPNISSKKGKKTLFLYAGVLILAIAAFLILKKSNKRR